MRTNMRVMVCFGSVLAILAIPQPGADARLTRNLAAAKLPERAILRMKPAVLAFGRIRVGSASKSLPVTLTNAGGAPLSIKGMSSSSDDFAIANGCASQLNGGGASCQARVTFVPKSDKRSRNTRIHGLLNITETSGRVHKVLLSGIAYGNELASTPTPSATPTPDPLVHAILVTNSACNTVTEYAIGAAGNVAPVFPQTGLCNPIGIAVDPNNNVYVANIGDNLAMASVTEYAPGSNGLAPPINTIIGPDTGLDLPTAIAVAGGKIYVANNGSDHGDPDTITVYNAGSSGDVTPIATISGPNTRLDDPSGVAVDGNGNIYVANPPDNMVTIYSAGSNGNVAPAKIIVGYDTGLFVPTAIAVDNDANIYVGSAGGITEYAAGSEGDASPIASINDEAAGISVDGEGNVYVASPEVLSGGPSSVDMFNPTGDGTFAFAFSISAFNPTALALDGNANIYVAEPNQDFIDFNNVDAFQEFEAGSNSLLNTVTAQFNSQVDPLGIAVDSEGNVYIANPFGFLDNFGFGEEVGSISIYAAGSGASGQPTDSIEADFDQSPAGLTFDSAGLLYVTSDSLGTEIPFGVRDSITIYAPFDDEFFEIATIEGSGTGLNEPSGIAVDGGGNIYVANAASDFLGTGDSITIYRQGSSGNVPPIATISGVNTGLAFPTGIALDGNLNIYVANKANDTITEYAAGSNGNVAPIATIGGSNTGLDTPSAIALDSTGIIYVTNEGGFEGGNASVTVYPAGSNGNVSPGLTIAGSNTQLGRPQGIVVLP